jgi:hypothetical protein
VTITGLAVLHPAPWLRRFQVMLWLRPLKRVGSERVSGHALCYVRPTSASNTSGSCSMQVTGYTIAVSVCIRNIKQIYIILLLFLISSPEARDRVAIASHLSQLIACVPYRECWIFWECNILSHPERSSYQQAHRLQGDINIPVHLRTVRGLPVPPAQVAGSHSK